MDVTLAETVRGPSRFRREPPQAVEFPPVFRDAKGQRNTWRSWFELYKRNIVAVSFGQEPAPYGPPPSGDSFAQDHGGTRNFREVG
jgi:hypothetical protein